MTQDDYTEFTLARYSELCSEVAENYQFLRFTDEPRGPGVLWRHDVDISVRQALRIAEIESELEILATYFLLPHAICFNLWSIENTEAARRIAALGHDIGLHFDPGFYGNDTTFGELEQDAGRERRWLEDLVGAPIASISFHNYGAIREILPETGQIAGMVNAYAAPFQSDYRYVSDSNGIWQYENLHEVVRSRRYDRLHALTHPVWWSNEPMAPRLRLQTCIDATANDMGKWYDEITAKYGRPNVRG